MGRGIIGKFLKGAAEVAVPAAYAEQAAQIQAKRDATLQAYAEKNLDTANKFQTSERVAGQEFTGGENRKNRTHAEGMQDDSQEFTGGENRKNRELTQEQLEMSKKQHEKVMKKMDQEIEANKYSLEQTKKIKTLMDKYEVSTDAVVRDGIAEAILILQGKDPSADYDFKTLRRTDPVTYEVVNDLIRVNKRTGQAEDITGQTNVPPSSKYKTPEEVRAAHASKLISREQARAEIKSMSAL